MMTYKSLLTLAAVFASATAQAVGTQLVVNPGFENSANLDMNPTPWTESGPNFSNAVTTQYAHTGTKSYAISNPLALGALTLSQDLSATMVNGACYTLSFYVYLDGSNPTNPSTSDLGLTVSLAGFSRAVPITTFPQNQWVGTSYNLLGGDASTNILRLTTYDNGGFYYLDDIAVTVQDPSVCIAPQPSQQARRRTRRRTHSSQW